jgi:hypothetical protein
MSSPRLAVSATGELWVAWLEAQDVRASRWRGRAWEPTEPVNNARGRADEALELALLPTGGPLLAWVERNAQDRPELHVAGRDDTVWRPLGGALNAPVTGRAVRHFALTAGADGTVVAFSETGLEPQGTLRTLRWDGRAWQPLGPPSLLEGVMVVTALTLTTLSDGALALAWTERVPGTAPRLQARRRPAAGTRWEPLPTDGAPAVDGDTRTLSLVPAADGGVYLACNGNAGLSGVARWVPGAAGWTSLALPDPRLAGVGGVHGPLLASRRDGTLAFAWRALGAPLGDRLAGARWTAVGWSALPGPLDLVPGATAEARIALGPDAELYAAWLETVDDRRRVRVSRMAAL